MSIGNQKGFNRGVDLNMFSKTQHECFGDFHPTNHKVVSPWDIFSAIKIGLIFPYWRRYNLPKI
jgi:hypothetical protein